MVDIRIINTKSQLKAALFECLFKGKYARGRAEGYSYDGLPLRKIAGRSRGEAVFEAQPLRHCVVCFAEQPVGICRLHAVGGVRNLRARRAALRAAYA